MIKKIIFLLFIVFVVGFIVIQFFRPDFTNPPIVTANTIESAMQVPDNVDVVLKRSCTDCHSNNTVYPWYAKIQPSAWFLKGHIDEGRQKLNFSTWANYDPAKQKRKLAGICEEMQSKEMPLPSYLWIHGDAKATDAEIKLVCDWTNAVRAQMPD